jgi:hypothetical protein
VFKTLRRYTPAVSCSSTIEPPVLGNATWSREINTRGVSVIQYMCNYGFVASVADPEASSVREIIGRCRDGVSVVVSASCIEGTCDLTDLRSMVKNGEVTSTAPVPRIGSVVTITCPTGYSIDGLPSGPRSRQLTCDDSARLSVVYSPGSDNDCKRISCGSVVVPANSEFANVVTLAKKMVYGDTVTFKCMSGFMFRGSTTATFGVVCDATGEFVRTDESTAIEECVPIQCPSPAPAFAGADLVGQSTDPVYLSNQVQYMCKRGMTFRNSTSVPSRVISGPFRIRCVLDQNGAPVYDTDQAVAHCAPEECPAPPLAPADTAIMVGSTDAKFFVGQSVEYTCAPGRMFNGNSNARISAYCTNERTWEQTDQFDVCVPVQCTSLSRAPPSMIQNAVVPADKLITPLGVGTSVDLECAAGFISSGSEELIRISCNQNGVMEVNGSCQRSCGPLPEIPPHASGVLSSGAPYRVGKFLPADLSAVVTCDSGHSIDGNPINGTAGNDRQILKCDTTKETIALPPVSACKPIVCGLPPSRLHATWISTAGNSVRSYATGESVAYNCNSGYGVYEQGKVVKHAYDLSCSDSGWDANAGECVEIACPNNPVIARGNLVGNVLERVTVGKTYSVQCAFGYAPGANANPNESATLTCTEFGDFAPSNYATDLCANVVCPKLPDTILGARRGDGGSLTDALSLGDPAALYYCNPEWNLPPIKVTCKEDRTYDVIGDECKIPTCDSVSLGISNVAAVSGNNTLGSVAEMSCADGYTTQDGSVHFQVKCTSTDGWVIQEPQNRGGCDVIARGNSIQVHLR